MATFAPFNPVGAFQTGRKNALAIQSKEQAIDSEASNAPLRNELNQLRLSEAQKASGRGDIQFSQNQQDRKLQQALQRAKILFNTATALRGVSPEQQAAAFRSLQSQLKGTGIDLGDIAPDQINNQNLDEVIATTGAFLSDPEGEFGRLVKAVDAQGNPVFAQANKSGDVNIAKGITPPKSDAAINRETKELELEEKKLQRAEGQRLKATTALSSIDTAIGQAQQFGTTGFVGGMTSAVPGTPAFQLNETLQPLRALISFKELNDMRAASPTGGALGNVTERELGLLSSTMGSLEQGQATEQLVNNLLRIQVIFRSVVDPVTFGAAVFTKEQFAKVPSGTRYIDGTDDGKLKVKP